MTTSGWIKLFRKIIDCDWYKSRPFDKTHAWVDLLLSASFETKEYMRRGRKLTVAPGGVISTCDELCDRWGWSRSKVLRYLDELETLQQITTDRSNCATVIYIQNWTEYQNGSAPALPSLDTPLDTAVNTALGTTLVSAPVSAPDTADDTPAGGALKGGGRKEEDKNVTYTHRADFPSEVFPVPSQSPEGVQAVRNAANAIGYPISDDEALNFIAYNSAQGWRIRNQPVRNWRALLIPWRNSARNRINPANTKKDYTGL